MTRGAVAVGLAAAVALCGLVAAPATAAPVLTAARAHTSPSAGPEWTETTVHLTYDGLARYYLVYRAAGTDGEALPVVMALHGHDASPEYEATRMDFREVAGPAVLVYPAGYGESWDAGHCCAAAYAAHVDDVGFLDTVLKRVLAGLPAASATKVYLAGYSNGGKMALTLDCDDPPGTFRAVAVYGATAVQSCTRLPATSTLVLASTGDPELTIGPGGAPQTVNGFTQPTVTDQVADYRRADRCATAGTAWTSGDLTITTWTCDDGRRVAMGLYAGGSHGWPTGTATTPSGQAAMWSFFAGQGADRT